jgi:predicted phage gp36 major capsid-like protein
MREILATLTVALAVGAMPASAQQVFRCDDGGNAFYYRVSPGEFRNWVGAGNGYAAHWLDNQCNQYTQCTWNNGVFSLYSETIDWLQEFDTNTGVYKWGSLEEEPTVQYCSRASDPPPA